MLFLTSGDVGGSIERLPQLAQRDIRFLVLHNRCARIRLQSDRTPLEATLSCDNQKARVTIVGRGRRLESIICCSNSFNSRLKNSARCKYDFGVSQLKSLSSRRKSSFVFLFG